MYLRGSRLNYSKKRQPSRLNIWRILVLVLLLAAAIYVNQVVVPITSPLFIATSTPTRAPESYVNEANNLMQQGKISQAIQMYRQAIQADPKDITNHITLARLLVLTGNYKDAVPNAENALLLAPNNSMAHAIRGWAMSYLGDFMPAEAAIKKAIELDPKNGAAYAYYAELLVQQNQAGQGGLGAMEKAAEASRTATSLSPDLIETHRARGLVLEITGNYKDAIQEYEAAIKLNDNIADLHIGLGRNYRYIQEYAKAVEEFNRANALSPQDPLPSTYISRTYATVGEFAKAIQFAQQAVKVAPTDPLLQGNLGSMLYRNRQYKEAVVALRLAVRGGTTEQGETVKPLTLDYGRVAEFYYTYALTLARLGECSEAIQISQTIQEGVASDDIAIYNAQEAINICKDLASGGGGGQAATKTSEENKEPTPAPTKKPTATPKGG